MIIIMQQCSILLLFTTLCAIVKCVVNVLTIISNLFLKLVERHACQMSY